MDEKKGRDFYPVFMINDKYGGRGLNFRAKSNTHGITMFIFGSVIDELTFHQLLSRVGRNGDNCQRVMDTSFKMFEDTKNATRKGMI